MALRARGSPLQSEINSSMAVPGDARRTSSTVDTKPAAPPSARSSWATKVDDRISQVEPNHCLRHPGWLGRIQWERLAGLDQAHPHAHVHWSPLIMNVAVPSAQHSKMLGQPASWHTVTSESSSTTCRRRAVFGTETGRAAATRAYVHVRRLRLPDRRRPRTSAGRACEPGYRRVPRRG